MNGKGLLIVEDDPGDEALILRALKKREIHAKVHVARDGAEAIDYLLPDVPKVGHPEVPALILLDLKMPKMDGLDVLQRLRQDERTRNLRIVVFSSSGQEKDIMESYRLGATSYVRKPVSSSEFTNAVGQIANYWLELNEAPIRPGEIRMSTPFSY